jgi:predicted 3-demethylubiquinone-9 3-methyltransferase (glyoxalase superfamily)
MKKYKLKFLTALVIAGIMGCGDSQQNSHKTNNIDTISSQTSAKKTDMITQKITPCLWVEKDAKAVANYYLSIFKDGKLKDFRRFGSNESGNDAGLETAVIEVAGIEFSILAAGPLFKFNESVSFVINTKDQAETDYYWDALTANGGEESSCGWCKDKYGLSWQVVPTEYFELIHSDNPKVREKAMKNTLKQKKLILTELK